MTAALALRPLIAPWAILLAAAALAVGTHLYYRDRLDGLSTGHRVLLAGLRTAGFALLVFALSGPSIEREKSIRKSTPLVVLLDTSSSMAERDSGPDGAEPRLDTARRALLAAAEGLAREYDVKVYTMSSNASFITGLSAGVAVAAIDALEPDGPTTAIGDALSQVSPRTPPAAVLVLSDGAENAGRPLSTAVAELAARGVKVFAVPLGRAGAPNVAVRRVLGPRLLLRDEPSAFFVEVAATPAVSGPVRLALKEGAKTLAAADVPPGSGRLARLDFRPTADGDITYTIEAAPVPAERFTADNAVMRTVRVAKEKLKVLYVEDEPRWEYRFLKNAVLRDERLAPRLLLLSGDKELAAEPEYIVSFPHERAEIFKFDCIVMGDVRPDFFLAGDLDSLRAFVSEGGGGILFVGGANFNPAAYTAGPLAELSPADYAGLAPASADGLSIALTDAGAANPALTLSQGDQKAFYARLPRILWLQRVRPRPAAVVLAESAPGGYPVIVEQPFGRGRTILVATDELWRWRSAGGDRCLYRLWAQLVRYLGARRLFSGASSGELILSADEYPLGADALATAYLENGLGMPLDDPAAEGVLESPDGARLNVVFPRQAGAPGLYRARFRVSAPGKYALHVRSVAGIVSAQFTVSDKTPEALSREADPVALEMLASATGGRMLAADRITDVIGLFPPETTREVLREFEPLWASYWVLLPLVALFGLEWFLRKRWGLL